MSTTNQITEAIAHSVSHNEIAKIEVEWPADSRGAEETIIDWLDEIEGVEDADCVQENDGSYDVWGKMNGEDFRLRLRNA